MYIYIVIFKHFSLKDQFKNPLKPALDFEENWILQWIKNYTWSKQYFWITGANLITIMKKVHYQEK